MHRGLSKDGIWLLVGCVTFFITSFFVYFAVYFKSIGG